MRVSAKGMLVPALEVNGIELAFDEIGHGPATLLIHGSLGSRVGAQPLLPLLEGSLRLVTYDRRGHGDSGGDAEAGTVHDDVADAAALIETLGLAPAHLLASSYGACIALRLASTRPELVGRMVCHEPPLMSALEQTSEGRVMAEAQRVNQSEAQRRLEAGDIAGGIEHFIDQIAFGQGTWARMPPPVREGVLANALTFLGELRDPDALQIDLAQLQRVQAPVLFTQGDQSPPEYALILDQVAAAVPHSERHVIEGAGHAASATHPEEYAALVRQFLVQS